MSVRLQVTLPDKLAADLKATARRLRTPVAQLVRDSMELRLRQLKTKRRKDPFASITGIVDSEGTDFSGRVDEILYR